MQCAKIVPDGSRMRADVRIRRRRRDLDPCLENSHRMPHSKGLEIRHITPATTTASLLSLLGSKAGKSAIG